MSVDVRVVVFVPDSHRHGFGFGDFGHLPIDKAIEYGVDVTGAKVEMLQLDNGEGHDRPTETVIRLSGCVWPKQRQY